MLTILDAAVPLGRVGRQGENHTLPANPCTVSFGSYLLRHTCLEFAGGVGGFRRRKHRNALRDDCRANPIGDLESSRILLHTYYTVYRNIYIQYVRSNIIAIYITTVGVNRMLFVSACLSCF